MEHIGCRNHKLAREAAGFLYFMHIDKNAGTSVRQILRQNYRAEALLEAGPLGRMGVDGRPKTLDGFDEDVYKFISEVQNRQYRIECVAANLPFGVDKFVNQPVRYFTFLREPVSRCFSYWYFAFQTRGTTALWSVLESYNFDLHRILQDGAAYQFSNDQVRMITGCSASEPGETEFKAACQIIEEWFVLAGAVEYMDACIKVLASRLAWRHVSSLRLNVGTQTDASILPASAHKYFREANEWDIRLYEWLVNKYLPVHLS
jgi:hypothetical protein